MWGYFFCVHVACWRYLERHRPGKISSVITERWDVVSPVPRRIFIEGDSYKVESYPAGMPEVDGDPAEPKMYGENLEVFVEVIWRDGDVIDLIEEISMYLLKGVDRETMRNGIIREKDLPKIDEEKVLRLERVLLQNYDEVYATAKE